MMESKSNIFFFILTLTTFVAGLNAQTISVFDFGIEKAKTDVDRYRVLYQAHCKAIEEHCGITYSGIKHLSIEIPENAQSIPLPAYTDFSNVELTVLNNYKDFYLFFSDNKLNEINISKRHIDEGQFRQYIPLKRGRILLIVEDQNPWVKKRQGHNYGAIRRDILLIEDGVAINNPIQAYNNNYSDPKCFFCEVEVDSLIIKNITIKRSDNSNKKTYCFRITNQNNIFLNRIKIVTPESSLTGDKAIVIKNCTNVYMEDVLIQGTYSKPNKSGYGISMDNVWNSQFNHLEALGNWGVFGNNNINYAKIDNSIINRFDIHCYGRDVYFENTVFKDLYNQFSSVFGTISFDSCKFEKFVPVLIEASYNAYTFFDLIIKNCKIDVDKERPYLVQAGKPHVTDSLRDELKVLCWPNINIEDTEVSLPSGISKWILLNTYAVPVPQMDGIESVILKNVVLLGINTGYKVELSNRHFSTKKRLNTQVINSNVDFIIK